MKGVVVFRESDFRAESSPDLFPLQIYGGAFMAEARDLLRSFLLLEPSRSKSCVMFIEGVEPRFVVVASILFGKVSDGPS